MPIVYKPEIGSLSEVPNGAWQSLQDQFPTVAGAATIATVNTIDFERGIRVVDGSKFTVDNSGLYNFVFSAQLNNTDGGGNDAHADIWLSKNGTAVPNSSGRASVTTNSRHSIAAWNYYMPLAAGDYLQLVFDVSDVGIGFDYTAPNTIPGTASLIVTMTQVG